MYKAGTTTAAALRQRPIATANGFSEADRNLIQSHLEDITLSPVFRNSKRYCALLRYVVERALEGQTELLKERTIGVEVFGRQADYDTTVDHSVRSAAGEVRKRLAQYYMEFSSDAGIRIELSPGSYVPQIRMLESLPAPVAPMPAAEPAPVAAPAIVRPIAPAVRSGLRGFQKVVAVQALAALLVFGVAFGAAWHNESAFDQLWNPILASGNAVQLCFGGGQAPPSAEAPATLGDFERTPARRMNVSDALALVSVTGTLRSKGKSYRILNRASSTSFTDLQQGPFILIGALNNEWSLRLTSGLRYTFGHSDQGAYIADRQNPGKTDWSVNMNVPFRQPSRDYAIVTRLRDPLTEQVGLVVAGIGSFGTQAAGEFVSSPEHLRKLDSFLPRHWEQKNLQVVIATDIIRGSSGPPMVLAAYLW